MNGTASATLGSRKWEERFECICTANRKRFNMSRALLCALIFSANTSCQISRSDHLDLPKRLVAFYDFSDKSQLSDWIAEGPVVVEIVDGQMTLESRYRIRLTEKLTPKEIWDGNGTNERIYRTALFPLISADEPDVLASYDHGSPIRYGHTVLWNKRRAPENFLIEFDFTNLSPYPLHLVHFSASALDGRSIFSADLAPRNGVASQYMNGDIQTYRISFFSRKRDSINMRKAPGRNLTAQSEFDPTSLNDGQTQRIAIRKLGSQITFSVDGVQALSYEDDTPLPAGYFGFRTMLLAKGSYDNVAIYELDTNF